MKETTTRLTEYGLPIDPDAMVTPPDVTELELEPGHPGLGDDGYIATAQGAVRSVPQAPAGATSARR